MLNNTLTYDRDHSRKPYLNIKIELYLFVTDMCLFYVSYILPLKHLICLALVSSLVLLYFQLFWGVGWGLLYTADSLECCFILIRMNIAVSRC